MLKKTIFWNAFSQLGTSGISFLSTIVLARFLSPDDFGIIGMISIFISFSQVLVDSEMGGALLRKKEITDIDYSTLFVYNIIVSIFLYLFLYVLAPYVAIFYEKPILISAIRILSLTVLLHAFRVVPRVILFREFKFKHMAIINVVSGMFSLIVAVQLAYKGYGFWALIYQQIISTISAVILLFLCNRYLPKLRFSYSSFREQFSFGINLLGADILKTIANNIHANVIAKIMPLKVTGYYVQTSRITNFGTTLLGSVLDQSLFPIMSRMDKKAFSETYMNILIVLNILILYITVIVITFSSSLIELLLGNDWVNASWMLSLLSITIYPSCIQILARNVLKAQGNTKSVLKLETYKSIFIIISLLFGFFGGIKGLLMGLVFVQFIIALISINYIKEYINISIWGHFKAMIVPLVLNIALLIFLQLIESFDICNSICIQSVKIIVCIVTLCIMLYLAKKQLLKNRMINS